MNSRKKILSILLGSISLISASAAISCTNKVDNLKQISRQFNKSKAKSQDRENLLLSIEKNKKYISNNELIDEAIRLQLDNINKKYLKNLNFLNIQEFQQIESINNIVKEISHNEETDNKNNSNLDKLKLLKKKKKELEQAWTKQKELKLKQKKLKNIIVGVSIGGAVVAGLSVGLGSYFGLKNINSEINKEVEKLKTRIFLNEDIIRQIKQKDSLFEVLQKILKVAFEKDLPNAIFNLVDKLLLKTVLKEYVTESSSNQLNEILKNEFKTKTTEIVNEILAGLSSINSNHNIDEIIKKTQEKISQVVTKFVPDFVKGTINYLSKTTDNSEVKKSIISLIIQNVLKQHHIIISDISGISELLEFYASKIITNGSDLISFIVEKFSSIIEKFKISFNIVKDFYQIINDAISSLLSTDGGKTISLPLLFSTLLPKLLKILNEVIDEKNSHKVLKFVNDLFEKEKNGHIKFVYEYITNKNSQGKRTTNVYLQNPEEININKIKFPKFEINLSTIIALFLNATNGIDLLKKFLSIFIKPISILLKEDSKKEEAKKALFRISSFFTFIYYKYVPSNFIFDIISQFANPINPSSFLEKLIGDEVKINNSAIELKDIFGYQKTGFFSKYYEIFELAKRAANEKETDKENSNKLKEALEKGILTDPNKK
ncbi:hypothetical protein [Mycoplasma phocimorsus]|uniref:hypothetical protein n=1 Tax=Mycoplasma phocimorsus TaxID=3045839 RepID=UPI0024BFE442|nr:hypothetical protein [Mycoplasma phocimorsus]MDJ1647144.1 hypothetical protein [Mycoplasma phocimorsus]